MSDAFLTLAHTDDGLSCFLVPRWKPDGTPNRFFIQRLKDKLGNRANASGEIEYDRTWAQMVGEPGRGIPTLMEMVNHTRLDCVIGSAALMRQALVQAVHHCRARMAFGKKLTEQPLMQSVLADLALESEAATVLMLHLAWAYDTAGASTREKSYARLATAIGKYWVCKRTTALVGEALECLGGAGYVEESILPRLYRESPLNSIWEGSGNVLCLDVFRVLQQEPETRTAFLRVLHTAMGHNRVFDDRVKGFEGLLDGLQDAEHRARFIVEQAAVLLQYSLLIRHAPGEVSSAFCAARLSDERGRAFGALPPGVDLKRIVDRAFPE